MVEYTTAPLFTGSDWTFETMDRTYAALADIAEHDLALNLYPNQIEVISSEQMLDAYSSTGMPLMYRHWSFGKAFLREEAMYRRGLRGLAYEIVINSNPCISYNMEENSMAMQTLVMAHAAFGHNHFFKNNRLFKAWSDASGVLDYLEYVRRFIANCEERYGEHEVEVILDAAHALMPNGVFRYQRAGPLSLKEEEARHRERLAQEEANVNYLWATTSSSSAKSEASRELDKRKKKLHLPEENLLYFLEQYSPILRNWQRELLRIIRHLAQYFYPQRQTKVMNEGCACFTHYYLVSELHRRGLITDGAMLEILHIHSNVLTQPGYDDPRFSGTNPYAFGFAILQDIKRMTSDPTEEDRTWFPDIAGRGDWLNLIKDIWCNYRDESFILQFLSPRLIRDQRLFATLNRDELKYVEVSDIHDESGYRNIREVLARNHDISVNDPDIQVVDVDLLGDRQLTLSLRNPSGRSLQESPREAVIEHIRKLWGYEVVLDD
ncbi:MAG: SpoVR family protein [Pseudomonadota bacterium]